MKRSLNLMALDLGSSSGRGILGQFDGERIDLSEVHRFSNGPIRMNTMVYWDALHIYNNVLTAFSKFKAMDIGTLNCFGIDAWGNDYGLLDRNGQLISNMRCSRHTTQADMDEVHKIIPGLEIYRKTGLASYSINTLYQVFRRIREQDPGIENADALMMVPDMIAYFCTGEQLSEYTISSCTMMYNPIKNDWDWDLIDRLGIPKNIFRRVMQAGQIGGKLTDWIASETGVGNVPYALVGSHDTASAVAACPVIDGSDDWAFCSSGTWCLIGVESEKPVFDDEMYRNKISNEGTVQGTFRPIKNMIGMWILQECIKKWAKEGVTLSYDDITEAANAAKPFRCFIDVDHPDFFEVGDMPERIRNYCVRTGQYVPNTIGEVARCIYESIALKFRWCMEWMDRVKGKHLSKVYIVGGGSRSTILNRMIADSANRLVVAGPAEASCMGNLLTQAMALGEVKDVSEIRQIVYASQRPEYYEPGNNVTGWDDAYSAFLKLLSIG